MAASSTRKAGILIGLLAVAGVAFVALVLCTPHGDGANDVRAAVDSEPRHAAVELAEVEPRVRIAASPPEGQPPPMLGSPDEDLTLEERLAEIARVEGAAIAAGRATAAQEARLEQLLRPLLEEPELFARILAHLVDGTWRAAGAAGPSAAEHGAQRAVYWALMAFHAPESELFDPEAGRQLFVDVLTVLPRLGGGAVLDGLVRQLTHAMAEGRPLVLVHLGDLIAMRATFLQHQELFSALLEGLGDTMTPQERTSFFGVFLSDTADPVLLTTTLRNLLRGTHPEVASQLAAALYDDPGASDELRKAIALAVVEGCEDPFRAAQFLARRADDLLNDPQPWIALGGREDGFLALEAAYRELAASDADPKAREKLVLGMANGSQEELRRLRRIALEDASPRVRGQGWLSLSSSKGWTPTAQDLDDLRAARGSGVGTLHVAWAASNLARRASGSVRAGAVSLLREVAVDAACTRYEREQAIDALRPFLPDHEVQSLIAALDP